MHQILSQPLDHRSLLDGSLYEYTLCDVSYSMDSEGFESGKSKRQLMLERSSNWLATKVIHRPQDFVMVIAFHDSATECCELLNVEEDSRAIKSAFRRVARIDSGGTSMCTGLRLVLRSVKQLQRDPEIKRAIASGELGLRCIAYSDGHDHATKEGIRIAKKLKERGVIIEALGVSRNRREIDEGYLRKVATTDDAGCHYRFLGDAETLDRTFKQLATGMLTIDD